MKCHPICTPSSKYLVYSFTPFLNLFDVSHQTALDSFFVVDGVQDLRIWRNDTRTSWQGVSCSPGYRWSYKILTDPNPGQKSFCSTHRNPVNDLKKHDDKKVGFLSLLLSYMEYRNSPSSSLYYVHFVNRGQFRNVREIFRIDNVKPTLSLCTI